MPFFYYLTLSDSLPPTIADDDMSSYADVGDANAPPAVTTGPEPAVTENSNDAPATSSDGGPAVRFSSAVDVAPNPPAVTASHEHVNVVHEVGGNHTFSDVAADQLKAFTKSLHGQPLQTKRMNTSYQFEAFSLPASRVTKPFSSTRRSYNKV
jgi:hypothetical protein